MKTVLLLTNQLHLALKISSAGNKRNIFINNVSQFDKVTSLLDSYDFAAFIIDLNLWKTTTAALKSIDSLKQDYNVPFVVFKDKLTNDEQSAIYEHHLDDFVYQPIDAEEIIIRTIHWINNYAKFSINTHKKKKKDIKTFNNFVVNLKNFKIIYNDVDLELTPKEFHLMYFLIQQSNQVLSREQIFNGVWKSDNDGDSYIPSRIVDIHISHLRDKINEVKKDDNVNIETVRGFGYLLKNK
ncbi:winged helix-turn-helix transcriptional regulator [Apilactobacillus xinyiensis]|uniref:winged helix-turn-helix transcriptional regulator n=1 Tax=Apilactobacillus xinyiensis TaxID=2841032 RepID=UPI001C7D8552|nr:response regulator transcription factor [Apilactobacillus xinyiensis]